jgi:hypothetical protein
VWVCGASALGFLGSKDVVKTLILSAAAQVIKLNFTYFCAVKIRSSYEYK